MDEAAGGLGREGEGKEPRRGAVSGQVPAPAAGDARVRVAAHLSCGARMLASRCPHQSALAYRLPQEDTHSQTL